MHTTNYTTQLLHNASRRATPSLSIVHIYVSAFTAIKQDPTPCTVIYSLGVVAVFRHAQDIVLGGYKQHAIFMDEIDQLRLPRLQIQITDTTRQ